MILYNKIGSNTANIRIKNYFTSKTQKYQPSTPGTSLRILFWTNSKEGINEYILSDYLDIFKIIMRSTTSRSLV